MEEAEEEAEQVPEDVPEDVAEAALAAVAEVATESSFRRLSVTFTVLSPTWMNSMTISKSMANLAVTKTIPRANSYLMLKVNCYILRFIHPVS